MKAPLEEGESEEHGRSHNEKDVAEDAKGTQASLRFKDRYIDVDGDFRKGILTRFQNWQEVLKIANEVHLDEMRVLLESEP